MDDTRKLSEDEVDVHSDANGNPVNQAANSKSKDDIDVKGKDQAAARIGLGTARRPPDRTWKEKVQKFFYDPDEGSFLGRTPVSWALITVFFICFYAVVVGLWLGCWFVFLQTMSMEEPKYTRTSSLISDNPGVGIKPSHEFEELEQHATVRPFFRLSNGSAVLEGETHRGKDNVENKRCADEIGNLLAKYKKPLVGSKYKHSFNTTESLGECAKPPYGYTKSLEPCFYLTLNKIWNWTFAPIKFEEDWPSDLKLRFQNATDKNQVFFNCDELKKRKKGSNATDTTGKIRFKYFPNHGGIPRKYFPYVGNSTKNIYHQPIVAVKLQFPPYDRDNKMHVIECKAYYDKVVHSSQLGRLRGLVQFKVEVKQKGKKN